MPLSSRFGFGLALSLIAGFSAPMVAPAPAIAQQQTFSDVSNEQFYAPYINRLSSLEIIKGFPDGTFHPNEPITRSQFAAILRQASFSQGGRTSAQSFSDVPANYWAADAIGAARANGFLSGYPGNQFKPEQKITRAEVLVSLANGLKYSGGSPTNLTYYRDANEVPTYARSAIAAADIAKLTNISGFPSAKNPLDLNHLYPNRAATRAEVAAFITQVFTNRGSFPPVPSLASEWPRDPVATLAVSASQVGVSDNGQRVVTLSDDGQTIQVWDTKTGESVAKIYRDNGRTHFDSVAISADGSRFAAIAQTAPVLTHLEAYMWNVQTGEEGGWSQSLGYLLGDSKGVIIDTTAKVAFSPDGRTLLTKVSPDSSSKDPDPGSKGPAKNEIRLLNSATGEVVQTFEMSDDPGDRDIRQFDFSPDGTLLAGAGYMPSPNMPPWNGKDYGESIDVWRLSDGKRLSTLSNWKLLSTGNPFLSVPETLPDYGGFVWMGFLPDNRVSVVTQEQASQQRNIWNPQTDEVSHAEAPFPSDSEIAPDYTSRDGQYFYINGDPKGGKIANFSTLEVRYLSNTPDKAGSFSANGNYLAIANDRVVQVFAKSNQP